MGAAELPNNLSDEKALKAWFDEQFDRRMQEYQDEKQPSLAIIATQGTLDFAYPPFILASTAAALDWEVNIFFTFYGLSLLKKDLELKVSPLGNPAMPMKMPMGPKWFQGINWNIPNSVMAGIPGFEGFATTLMKKTTESRGVASIETLREVCIESEVKLYACQMTVDLFGFKKEEFIDEVGDWVGAASFLPMAQKADVTLFI